MNATSFLFFVTMKPKLVVLKLSQATYEKLAAIAALESVTVEAMLESNASTLAEKITTDVSLRTSIWVSEGLEIVKKFPSGHVFTGKDLLNAAASPAELMTFGKKLRARLQDSGLVSEIDTTKSTIHYTRK